MCIKKAKSHRDPIQVLHESIRENYEIYETLNNNGKRPKENICKNCSNQLCFWRSPKNKKCLLQLILKNYNKQILEIHQEDEKVTKILESERRSNRYPIYHVY